MDVKSDNHAIEQSRYIEIFDIKTDDTTGNDRPTGISTTI